MVQLNIVTGSFTGLQSSCVSVSFMPKDASKTFDCLQQFARPGNAHKEITARWVPCHWHRQATHIHLMTFPYFAAYHMTKLFGAGKVGGGWGVKHVVSVPPSTPRSAAIFLPAAARNVLPQSHTPPPCSQIRFQTIVDQTGR